MFAVYNLPDFSFNKYIQISQPILEAQGGKIHDGWIYFSCDDPGKNIYRRVTVQVTGTWSNGTSRTVESAPVRVLPGAPNR